MRAMFLRSLYSFLYKILSWLFPLKTGAKLMRHFYQPVKDELQKNRYMNKERIVAFDGMTVEAKCIRFSYKGVTITLKGVLNFYCIIVASGEKLNSYNYIFRRVYALRVYKTVFELAEFLNATEREFKKEKYEVSDCSKCPYLEYNIDESCDSDEVSAFCKKADDMTVEKTMPLPEWCPFLGNTLTLIYKRD